MRLTRRGWTVIAVTAFLLIAALVLATGEYVMTWTGPVRMWDL